jgi:hypothetical protein
VDELVSPTRLDSETFGELGLGQIEYSHDNVSHLDPGVIDIVLNFNCGTEAAQAATQDVAQHRIPEMADVRGLVGIDGGVLDDSLHTLRDVLGIPAGEELAEKTTTVEVEIEKTGSSNFDPDNLVGPLRALTNPLRDMSGCRFELTRKGQGTRPGEVTELSPGRYLEFDVVSAVAELRLECFGERLRSSAFD